MQNDNPYDPYSSATDADSGLTPDEYAALLTDQGPSREALDRAKDGPGGEAFTDQELVDEAKETGCLSRSMSKADISEEQLMRVAKQIIDPPLVGGGQGRPDFNPAPEPITTTLWGWLIFGLGFCAVVGAAMAAGAWLTGGE